MNTPKVSILIPVYNRENFIGECIESALAQTYTHIEVVVVDNASTDGTWAICQQFAAKDRRVRVFRNETNIGPVLNWKRCIDEATGLYGKILFSDDLIEPGFIERAVQFFQNPEVGFVYSSVTLGIAPGKGCVSYKFANETGMYSSAEFINRSLFGGDVPISPGCAIFRMEDLKTDLVIDIPSPTIKDFLAHGAGPDLLLYLLAAKAYASFAYINEPLCFFRAHEGSISISDKSQYLSRCYTQAKIWFAESYFDADRIKTFYINTWYEYCRGTDNWLTPSAFLRDYTTCACGNLGGQLFKLIASRVYGKVRRLVGEKNH